MTIRINDFARQWTDAGPDVLAAVERAGASGWYVLGAEVAQFEQALAEQFGCAAAVGVASGLDAIEIGLRVLGVRPGDRVLTTPLSAFATTLAIVRAGAVPVFCDTAPDGNLDLDRAERALDAASSIRFCVPVHLYGRVLDCRRLLQRVAVLEDCAQSIGVTRITAACAATSFYPTKNLGAMGDGGALLFRDMGGDAQARVLRDYGQSAKYQHTAIGWNSRLDEVQAAILRTALLPRLAGWNAVRAQVAHRYLAGISNPRVQLPEALGNSNWHLFPVYVSARDAFIAWMRSRGIETGIHYPNLIPDQPAMRGVPFQCLDNLETARRIAATEVSLPIHPYLTPEEVEVVIAAANAWAD